MCSRTIGEIMRVYVEYVENDMILKVELNIIALKSSVFWDIIPCSPLKVNRCHFILQGLRTNCLLSASCEGYNSFSCRIYHNGHLSQRS
jgi:hypothetical protein